MTLNYHFLKTGLLLAVVMLHASSTNAQPAGKPSSQPLNTAANGATSPPLPKELPKEVLTTLPVGMGLPVVVRVGVYFVEITAVDENEGGFKATIDLRLRWSDPRLRYPPKESPGGFKEFRTTEAEAKLSEIWTPEVGLGNMLGEPTYQRKGLRIYPDGRVELMQRTTAQFSTPFDLEQFPFDRQKLQVGLISRRESVERVALDFRQDDLGFTRVAPETMLEGWVLGLANLRREPLAGWYGESHSRLWATLEIMRLPGNAVATIFIPLFASLLIPLVAVWLNRIENGEFKIEAFELASIIIGGVFAVIALNFTVNSGNKMLAAGDNTVARLFGLNYLALAMSLMTNIVLFRFNLAKRLFGPYVQEQLYNFIAWAFPLLALASATAIVFLALV